MSAFSLLGAFEAQAFLNEYWQTKPLLIRGGLRDFQCPVTADDLAALACQADVESRLVLKTGQAHRVQHGPFEEALLESLPASNWTLLVQDVDKHDPDVRTLLEAAAFLPSWRIDDVMISCAAPGGGVGPHVDSYDVFLVQGPGRRRWQISREFEACEEMDPGGLRTLRHFEPEAEWIVECGDVLYLPPGVAHHGVALDECLTLSIGLRAPSARELLVSFADFALELASDRRFTDAARALPRHPGELEATDRAQLRQLIRDAASLCDADLDRFLGRFLSEPKAHLLDANDDSTVQPTPFIERLRAGAGLWVLAAARPLFIDEGSQVSFFAAGHEFKTSRGFAELLTGPQPIRLVDCEMRVFEENSNLLSALIESGLAALDQSGE